MTAFSIGWRGDDSVLPMAGSVVRYYGYVDKNYKQTSRMAAHPFASLPSRTFYLSDEPISMRKFCECSRPSLPWRGRGLADTGAAPSDARPDRRRC